MNTSPDNKLLYAFGFGRTRHLLYKLKNIDHTYIIFPNNLNFYLKKLIQTQPAFILGLGGYSGIDQDKIRLETICSNKSGKKFIEGTVLTYAKMNPFLTPLPTMKYATALGNSHCNRISWEITKLINQGLLKSQYTFLHIPKKINSSIASQDIEKAILNFYTTLNQVRPTEEDQTSPPHTS